MHVCLGAGKEQRSPNVYLYTPMVSVSGSMVTFILKGLHVTLDLIQDHKERDSFRMMVCVCLFFLLKELATPAFW